VLCEEPRLGQPPVELFRNACIQALEVPTFFLMDAFYRNAGEMRSVTDPQNAASLISEFLNAEGYNFPWGYLIETRLDLIDPKTKYPGSLHWRFVPLELWLSEVDTVAGSPLSIPEQLAAVEEDVFWTIFRNSPDYLVPAERRAHDLFALMSFREDNDRARGWISDKLLPDILSPILEHVRGALRSVASIQIPPLGMQH
jgi:hypothetical protein